MAPRGLTFSPRPEFSVDAFPAIVNSNKKFVKIRVAHRVKDFTDDDVDIQLMSITSSDPDINVSKMIKGAKFDKRDFKFKLRNKNDSHEDIV